LFLVFLSCFSFISTRDTFILGRFKLFLLFLLLYEKSLLLYKIQEISFIIQEARSLICYIGSLFYFKSYTCTYIPFTLVFTYSFFYF
jgi:hypothetical protein